MRATVIAAAIHFRGAMRAYLAGQAAAMKQGATLHELVMGNQEGFQEAAQAEEALFALLDTLEGMQAGAQSEKHHANRQA
jgi:hypothetical protein